MTREQIRAAVTDEIALTCTLLGEAAGEPIEGQIAVACVIRNRVKADLGHDEKPDWWGEGYVGCCLKVWQFSCWWETSQNSDRVYALAQALVEKQPAGTGGVVPQLRWIAQGVIGGVILDLVKGSDHYLTTALLHSAKAPSWSKGSQAIVVVGHHTFFRLN